MKMVKLTCTTTSRIAGSYIIQATSNYAAKEGCFDGDLLQTYLSLCENPDVTIQKESILNLNAVLKSLSPEIATSTIFPEVNLLAS